MPDRLLTLVIQTLTAIVVTLGAAVVLVQICKAVGF